MIVDDDGALEKSKYVTELLVDEFNISLENTGGYAWWINGNHERHNRSIHNMVRASLIDSNQHENKCCCEAKTYAEVYI